METADAVVIGAGVVGLSIARHLSMKGIRTVVLERELSAGWGETSRCTGGIRHQFTSPVNIRLTQMSLPFFSHLEEETGAAVEFEQSGYLFLTAKASKLEEFRANVEMQRALDVPSELVHPGRVGDIFPSLRTDDLAGGTFCPVDAQASPDGVVQGLVRLLGRVETVLLTDEPVSSISPLRGGTFVVRTRRHGFSTPLLFSAAGPWSAEVGRMVGIDLPVTVHPRQVFLVDSIPSLDYPVPLTVDLDTGWYLHRSHGGRFYTGGTDKECLPQWNTAVDWAKLGVLIEAATARLPAIERAGISHGYVGLRSMSPDYNAILGEHPQVPGLFWAGGFSGHGFMHAPAVGRLLAEMAVDGRTSLDIGSLSPARFVSRLEAVEGCIF
ncbi:MAG: FAD-binding oxidoreductase [Firmicutes bacterium]|nr:FAD-binding oxidoreductase [Bacillota bacterium]